jgi:hypothetical protein
VGKRGSVTLGRHKQMEKISPLFKQNGLETMNEKTQHALNLLHRIRSEEMYRQANDKRTHLNIIERDQLDYAIALLKEVLESESVGV